MKTKSFFIALACAMLSMPIMAQNNQQSGERQQRRPGEGMQMNREKMKEMQVNQVVNALMLGDAMAAKFKPVYENYLKELGEARTFGMKKVKDQPLTDAQIEEGIKNRFAQSRKMLDVREKYYNEFKKYLTPKQILKVYQLEKNNGQRIQKEFRKRMHNNKDMRTEWGKYNMKKNPEKDNKSK